jgi:hypothetical protein
MIALALSLTGLDVDGPAVVEISKFRATKVLGKRSSRSGVEYGGVVQKMLPDLAPSLDQMTRIVI